MKPSLTYKYIHDIVKRRMLQTLSIERRIDTMWPNQEDVRRDLRLNEVQFGELWRLFDMQRTDWPATLQTHFQGISLSEDVPAGEIVDFVRKNY